MKEQNKRPSFPEDFFSRPRPKVTTKEALKDIIPIKWSEKVESREKKALVRARQSKRSIIKY